MARQGGSLLDAISDLLERILGSSGNRRPASQNSTHLSDPQNTIRIQVRTPPLQAPTSPAVRYRSSPNRAKKSAGIRFKSVADEAKPGAGSISGLRDAFTGELLDPAQGLFQCPKCRVYYQRSSMAVIKSENGGRCVSCLETKIRAVELRGEAPAGQNYQAQVVTLTDYRQHIGHVITFEGSVPRVNPSRDGRSYAVMFQDTSWNRGLKMVVFKGKVREVGGSRFLIGLKGKTIRVRGLLTSHPTFGPQIIVSERSMILSVR